MRDKKSWEERHRKRLKEAADKPVNERIQAQHDWRTKRKPPFATERWDSNTYIRPTVFEKQSWLFKTTMRFRASLPWWFVEWVIRHSVLEQHRHHAKIADISLREYVDNWVKLVKHRREWYGNERDGD